MAAAGANATQQQEHQQQQQLRQQAQATEGPQQQTEASEIPTPGTPLPQRHNIGTPGVESGDVQVIIEQMNQMMVMLKEQLAALEGKAKPTAAAGPSEGEDPFKRGDPWQRPATGPPGMPIPVTEPGMPIPVTETRAGPDLGPKPLDKKDVEKPNKYSGDVDSWISWSKSF